MILCPFYPSPRSRIGTSYSPTPFQYSISEYTCSPVNALYWERWAGSLTLERSQVHFLEHLAGGYERRRSVSVHDLIPLQYLELFLQATLPEYFVESWTYSSALSVVEQCDSWANGLKLEGSAQAAIHASKGELLELARNQVKFLCNALLQFINISQLDIVGINVGHLPKQPPFSLTITHSTPNSANGAARRSSLKISKAEFLSSLGDREAFYDLYVATTNRAIDMYAKGGRRKFALKLHGTLAALDVWVHFSPSCTQR